MKRKFRKEVENMNQYTGQSITASIINIVAGLWLLISVGIFDPISSAMSTNFVVLGIAIIVVALIRAFTPYASNFLSWVNVLFAIWLVISPFVIGYVNSSVMWNAVITGVIVGIVALWNTSAATVGVAHAKGRDNDRW